MEPLKKIVSGYRLYISTFITLSILTLLSVWLTHIRIHQIVVVSFIMIIAVIQATIVLLYNMHLKFHEPILKVMVGGVMLLIFFLLIATLTDYIYR